MSIPLIGGSRERSVQMKLPKLNLATPEEIENIRILGYLTELDPNIANLLIQMIDAAFKHFPEVFEACSAPQLDLVNAQTKRLFQFAIVLTDPLPPEERKLRDEQARKLLA